MMRSNKRFPIFLSHQNVGKVTNNSIRVWICFCCLFFLLGKREAVYVVEGLSSSSSSLSPLVGTKWKLNLDVGLQPGTWMPKRFPGWAESGARLGLNVEIQFTNQPSKQRESLVGPKADTYQLLGGECTYVSERGQQTVQFTKGGWCIQRPQNVIRNAAGSLVQPEGLLRFWLDCPTGAKRRDVEIKKGTRIFFTTGVWDYDDPNVINAQDQEYRNVLTQLEELTNDTRQLRKESEDQNVIQNIKSYGDLLTKIKEFDRLQSLKEKYERELPPIGTSVASNGVQIAPTGSLVIKGNKIPDWLPGSEYLILGTFSTTALE